MPNTTQDERYNMRYIAVIRPSLSYSKKTNTKTQMRPHPAPVKTMNNTPSKKNQLLLTGENQEMISYFLLLLC
jgi:hypothetical protein